MIKVDLNKLAAPTSAPSKTGSGGWRIVARNKKGSSPSMSGAATVSVGADSGGKTTRGEQQG